MLIMNEWRAMGFDWHILRDRQRSWFFLERDGKIVAEGGEKNKLMELGWF